MFDKLPFPFWLRRLHYFSWAPGTWPSLPGLIRPNCVVPNVLSFSFGKVLLEKMLENHPNKQLAVDCYKYLFYEAVIRNRGVVKLAFSSYLYSISTLLQICHSLF